MTENGEVTDLSEAPPDEEGPNDAEPLPELPDTPWGRAWQSYWGLPDRERYLVTAGVVVVGLLLLYGMVQVYARAQIDESELVVERVRVTGGDATAEELELRLTCRITNPSSFGATVQKSRFEVYYQKELAGIAHVPKVELPRGENTVEIEIVLENRNSPAFAILTYELLAGRELIVNIQGDIEVDSWLNLGLPVDKKVLVEGLGW